MVTNSALAELFVNGTQNAKGSNMFIEDGVIYSYGHHFPIAFCMRDGTYAFNSDGYSNSTARHKSYVYRALHSENKIMLTTGEMKKALNVNAGGVMIAFREVDPQSHEDLQRLIISFYKSQGIGRRATIRAKKFIEEMTQLAVLSNL